MAVIFDLDGTLINSIKFHFKSFYPSLIKTLKIKIDPKFVMGMIEYPTSFSLKAIEKKYRIKISKDQIAEIVGFTNSSVNEDNVRKGVKFYPGAVSTAKLLKSRGIKVGIATSMDSAQLKIFKKVFELEKIASAITNPNSLKQDKPNPYILNRAIKLLGAQRKSVFYVGDAPTDYAASKNAGIKFIGVRDERLREFGLFFPDMRALYKHIKTHLDDFE